MRHTFIWARVRFQTDSKTEFKAEGTRYEPTVSVSKPTNELRLFGQVKGRFVLASACEVPCELSRL